MVTLTKKDARALAICLHKRVNITENNLRPVYKMKETRKNTLKSFMEMGVLERNSALGVVVKAGAEDYARRLISNHA